MFYDLVTSFCYTKQVISLGRYIAYLKASSILAHRVLFLKSFLICSTFPYFVIFMSRNKIGLLQSIGLFIPVDGRR